MAAPTNAANVKKVLANSEPSTHGTKQTSVRVASMSAVEVKRQSLHLNLMSAFDPKRTSAAVSR
jgi:hypothetical protein